MLMSATCFPFGGPKDIEPELIELKEKTDGTFMGAMVYADEQMQKAMQEYRESQVSQTPD